MATAASSAQGSETKVRLLSIDGGGIRGILPATVMVYVEEEIRRLTGDKKAKIGEYFDMISGTSTGGILASLYLAPASPGKPEARFDAKQALKLYLEHGRRIFARGFWDNVSQFTLWNEKFRADNLQKLLDDYFGDTRLSDLIRPCLITAYDFSKRRAAFFNSADARREAGAVKDFYVKNITRATSAAPTYFEPAQIKSLGGGVFNLIDGGVFVNNPAMCAYSEARATAFGQDPFMQDRFKQEKPNCPTAKQMYHVSAGTGSESPKFRFEKLRNAGLIGWLPVIIDIMMSGSSETVHYHLRKVYDTLENGEDRADYIRLEPSRGDAASAMDCVTKKNLAALNEAGNMFVFENQPVLNSIAARLVTYA